MKYAKIVCALFFILIYSSYANAQIDAVKIENAKKAFKERDYKAALEELNQVSKTGQKNKLYLYYKGYSFYGLKQLDSAKKYFKKYLILDVNDKDTFEKLTEVENRLKWFAEAPPMEETINWLTSKIDGTGGDGVYRYKNKVINKKIIVEAYEQANNELVYISTLDFKDLWNPLVIKSDGNYKNDKDHILLTTSGNKINIDYHASWAKNKNEKNNTLGLYLKFDAEPSLLNKLYKAFSNIALENVKNMPTETY
jgi:tetratricopeptide (TPR) repeat protein